MNMADNKDYPKIKRRVWEIQSQCEHNGKAIWTPDIVTKVIEQLASEKLSNGKPALKRWAWCLHDKDKVREENIEQLRLTDPLKEYKIGDARPAHIHLALEFENAVYNTHLAKVAGLDIHFVRKPEARYMQFMAISCYLSHCKQAEQDKGKHLYPVDEIHCNFNYAEEVDAYLAKTRNTVQRSNPRNLANTYINRIESGNLKFEDAKREIRESAEGYAFFLRYEKELRAARAEYIKRRYEMKPRINYYIYGKSGTGKSTMSKYLARALFTGLEESECYFTVGEKGVRYDSYEYQPCLLFEDVRGEKLCQEYGSEGILNLLELNPKKRSYNIKYGSVTLTHQVNIFTTTDSFETFTAELMQEEKDDEYISLEERIEQVKRRFPVVIKVMRNEVEVYANLRIFEKNHPPVSEYKRYARVLNVNIAKLLQNYAGAALDETFKKITEPIVKLHKEYMNNMSSDPKFLGEEDAPKKIKIIEGYQEVEESLHEKAQYLNCCEAFLKYHKLDDGSFGPYKSKKEWSLGDELDGDYEGIYCPFTFDQWKDMGRPDGENIVKEGIGDDMYGEDLAESSAHKSEIEYERKMLSWSQQVGIQNSTDPEENMALLEAAAEERENLDAKASEDFDEEQFRSQESDELHEYVVLIRFFTSEFLYTKKMEDFRAWCHSLIDYHLYSYIKYFYVTWNCLMEKWNEVKDACISAGFAKDDISWYKLYQKCNVHSEMIEQ